MIRNLKLLSFVVLCLSLGSCKKIIKSSDNFIEHKVLSKGGKEISKEAAERSAKEFGNSYVGKSAGHQLVRNAVRKKVEKEMEEEGAKSFFQFGGQRASKELAHISTSSVKKELFRNHSKTKYYDGIKELSINNPGILKEQSKNTGNYLSKTMTRILIKSKNQYITQKQYLEWVSKYGDEIKKTGIKDPNVLRENMYKVMGKNGKYAKNTLKNGNQAHHIIGNKTPAAAAKLKKYGIDINDPMNGIFLPSSNQSGLRGTIHRGGHTQDYYDYVEQMFANCHSQKDCYEVLDKIKDDLYKGKIQLYSDAKHEVNGTFKQAV